MRTPKEIKAEVAALLRLKKKLPKLSPHGHDNHACVIAQIEVLNTPMTEDTIFERGDAEATPKAKLWNADVRDSAEAALKWKTGESFEAPSVDWEMMIKKG